MKHPIPDEALARPIAFVGTVGSGKTFAAKGTLERPLAQGSRVCIVDPTGAWWGLKSSADGKSAGFPVVVFGGDHADVPIDDRAGAALGELVAKGALQCVVDVSGMTMGGRVRFMTEFQEALYHHNRATLYLVYDEADMFAPQRPMPDQTVMLNRAEQIVRRGRIKGLRVMMITQRPAELHKSVLSQAGTLVALKLTSPQDRKAIGEWIKGQADEKKGAALLADVPLHKTGELDYARQRVRLARRRLVSAMADFDRAMSRPVSYDMAA
jgi:DNA helicase HerA-like ATPase